MTLEKASHQGKEALLDLAQQPGMQQVSCEGFKCLSGVTPKQHRI